jgi:hypothetical protein
MSIFMDYDVHLVVVVVAAAVVVNMYKYMYARAHWPYDMTEQAA